MRYLLIVISLHSVQCSVAQSNVVLNPGFEEHYDTSAIGIASFRLGFVTGWSDPNDASSDYFVPNSHGTTTDPPQSFTGFEYPHNGYSYAGFLIYEQPPSEGHEYIQASFSSPLQNGHTYAIESYVSLADGINSICVSDLGFYFSDTQLTYNGLTGPGTNRLPFIPQYENPSSNMITAHQDWQHITGNYTAHGGERYMSIGSFVSNISAHTDPCLSYGGMTTSDAYLFIDDVAVYDTSKIDTVTLCMGDSVQIGGVWRSNPGVFADTIGGLLVDFYIQFRPYTNNLTQIDKPFEFGDSVRITLLQSPGIDSSDITRNFIWVKNDTNVIIPMYNIYGCDSIIRYVCRTNVGINNLFNGDMTWSIYPNPASDFLHIILMKNDPANYSITVIDVTGRQVLSHSLLNDRIDVSSLKSGMYFIKLINIRTGNIVGTEKFVKSN